MVWSTAPEQDLVEGFSSYPDFRDWKEQASAFSGLAAFWTFPNGDVNLTGGTEPQRVSVARVSPGFFEVLGIAPLYGRTFLPEESVHNSQPTTATIRKLVHDVDPSLPLHHVRLLDELVARSVAQQRFHMLLVGSFCLLILVVAVIGTYGVASYGVSERMGELALRVALGSPDKKSETWCCPTACDWRLWASSSEE